MLFVLMLLYMCGMGWMEDEQERWADPRASDELWGSHAVQARSLDGQCQRQLSYQCGIAAWAELPVV